MRRDAFGTSGYVTAKSSICLQGYRLRLTYHAVGGSATHHNAYFHVLPTSDGMTKALWVTDLLPDQMKAPIEQMLEVGWVAMQKTLEQSFLGSQ